MADTNKPLDLAKRVTVRNTTNIDTFFRYALKSADGKITKKAKLSMSVEEILAQCDNGNPDFVGRNRDGKHCTFYIEDKDVRVYLGFESEDGKQKQEVIDEQAIVDIFETPNLAAFAGQLETKVVTMGERQTLRDIVASGKVNAHDKIEMAKKYLHGEAIEVPKKPAGRPPKKPDGEAPA
jgi:hypothetical protein